MIHKASAAVMARRKNDKTDLDFYRTPAWATRSLFEMLSHHDLIKHDQSVLDPCAGAGDMSRELKHHFRRVTTMDIERYDGLELDFQRDFLSMEPIDSHDWVIANPPFNLAEPFISRSMITAWDGVAILGRIQLLESVQRFANIWNYNPCQFVFIFCERLGFAKGYGEAVQSAACHAWFVWLTDSDQTVPPMVDWIRPGSRERLSYV